MDNAYTELEMSDYTQPRRVYELKDSGIPKCLILALPQALSLIDEIVANPEFPEIDADELLTKVVDGLFFRPSFWNRKDRILEIVREIVHEYAMNFQDGLVNQFQLTTSITLVFELCYPILLQHNLYIYQGVFPYNYQQRRGRDAILLSRTERIALD